MTLITSNAGKGKRETKGLASKTKKREEQGIGGGRVRRGVKGWRRNKDERKNNELRPKVFIT